MTTAWPGVPSKVHSLDSPALMVPDLVSPNPIAALGAGVGPGGGVTVGAGVGVAAGTGVKVAVGTGVGVPAGGVPAAKETS